MKGNADNDVNARVIVAARRLLDLLTIDGDPPAVAIPQDVDANKFCSAFSDLAAALSTTGRDPP